MTTTQQPTMGAAELAYLARQTWQQAVVKPPAVELGAQFGRSERWARDRIREARADVLTIPDRPVAVPAEETATAWVDPYGTADLLEEIGHPAGPATAVAVELPPTAEPAASAAVSVNPAADPAIDHALVPAGVTVRPGGQMDAGTRLTWWLSVVAVVVVGGVALVMSYDHMRMLAAEVGEGWLSWLLPVSVDGLMIAASSVILARQRQGLDAGWLPWLALAAGVAFSVAANVAQAGAMLPAGSDEMVKARVLAAWPPVAALAGVELLMRQIRSRQESAE